MLCTACNHHFLVVRCKYLTFVLSSHRTQQLTLIQNGGGYKEHAVISNIRSFPRIYLLSLSVSQNAVAKLKKLRAKSWFKQLDPGLLSKGPGSISCGFMRHLRRWWTIDSRLGFSLNTSISLINIFPLVLNNVFHTSTTDAIMCCLSSWQLKERN